MPSNGQITFWTGTTSQGGDDNHFGNKVVNYEENGIDAKSIDYPRLVAVLIEAIKEQFLLYLWRITCLKSLINI
ncbi:MAG: hypothetical protein QME58_05345 [Bacteroidota bacterium]|nr:hypothetical protein [Bacteroidota bacterium]